MKLEDRGTPAGEHRFAHSNHFRSSMPERDHTGDLFRVVTRCGCGLQHEMLIAGTMEAFKEGFKSPALQDLMARNTTKPFTRIPCDPRIVRRWDRSKGKASRMHDETS
jgi:hypothetical protein